jgi:hypothetical protein
MLSTDINLKNALMQNTSLSVSNKIIIENNINDIAKYIKVEDLNNSNDVFSEIFPVKSVVKSFRPSKAGIKYKILGESTTLNTYKTKTIPATRIYMADKSNDYTYFLRPTTAQVKVSYFTNSAMTTAQTVYANKIVVKAETGHGIPTVNIKFGSTVVYNQAAPADGVVTLWLNGTSWSTTEPSSYTTPISFDSITVALSGTSYVGLIEVSPRIVKDISDRVASVRIDKDDSIGSDILPVGALTANSASLELFGLTKTDILHISKGDILSASSIMLAKNTKFTISFIIDGTYTIQQGVFYGVDITSKDLGEFSVKALDGAKFLQETPCPEIILTDSSFQAILWRMLDAVGFTAYDFTKCTGDVMSCRYWWGDKSKTVWQAIQEICKETQTVAFFNEYDVLCFISRDKFYDSSAASQWQFLYADEGSNKANIASLDSSTTPTSSAVRIKYNVPTTSNLERSMQPIWTEQAPSTLFASPYQGIETVGSTQYLKYSKHGVFGSVIPTRFNSYALVGNEVIEYDGIEFSYPAVTPEVSPRVFTSLGEYLEVRARYSNDLAPTGRLRIKTRGAFGTTVTSPALNPTASAILDPFTAGKFKLGTTTQLESASKNTICAINYTESNISSIAMSPNSDREYLHILTRNMPHSTSANPIVQYGTAAGFKLDTTSTTTSLQQTAGFALNWNSLTMSGYIVLVNSTRAAQETKSQVEVQFIKLVSGAVTKIETVMSNVFEQAFFGIDVVLRKNSTSNDLLIYVNGSELKITDDQPLSSSPTIGLICGGQTTAYFDYVYSGPLSIFAADITGSRSSGKITADAFFKNFKFNNTASNGLFIDEFGPVIREIYKASPTYNQAFPVFSEASNPLAIVVSERLGHFSGDIYIFNSSSSTIALADGDGKEFAVWGIAIANAGENIYETEKNIDGVTEFTTFETNWIQSESSAKTLADFLSKQWSKSIRDVDMSIFGNPILQVGDIVTIKYTDRDLQGTEKFVIRAISHSYGGGLETQIKARSIYSA